MTATKTDDRCDYLPSLAPTPTPTEWWENEDNYGGGGGMPDGYGTAGGGGGGGTEDGYGTAGGGGRKLQECAQMEMMDAWGDGFLNEWTDSAESVIELKDSAGTVLKTFDGIGGPDGSSGWSGSEPLCEIEADGCYTITVPECNWGWEASWRLGFDNDMVSGCGTEASFFVSGAGTPNMYIQQTAGPDECAGMTAPAVMPEAPPQLVSVSVTFEVLTENLCMSWECDGEGEVFDIPAEVADAELVLIDVVNRPEFPEMVKAAMHKKVTEMMGESDFPAAEEEEIWTQTEQNVVASDLEINVGDAFLHEIVSSEESFTLNGGPASTVAISMAATVIAAIVALVIL